MQVRDMMNPSPSTIADTDTLGSAQRIMVRERICHLPVLSGDRLVGLLSERDLLATRASDGTRDWWTVGVREVMHADPHTAHPDDGLAGIEARLAVDHVGALPVIERGVLVGMVTTSDVLAAEVRMAPRVGPSVASAMTRKPLTVGPDTLVLAAIARMVDHRIRHLPVVDAAGALIGMLSERDVRSTFGGMDTRSAADFSRCQVHELMSRPARTVREDATLGDAIHELVAQRIGALAVVDAAGALVGIVSYVDALRLLAI